MATTSISREEMERVIDQGGSVLYQGRILTRKAELPSAAELAKGSPEDEAAVRSQLQTQIDALKAELASLKPAKPASEPAGDQEPKQ